MNNKQFLLFKIFLICIVFSFQAQNAVDQLGTHYFIGSGEAVKKDGRFSVIIKGGESSNRDVVNNRSLLKSIDLNVQWWTLLGEPLEYYDIKWTARDKYEIDNKFVYRNKLEKYPDLLKRFDNLRPTKLSIRITGDYSFSDEIEVSRSPSPELTPFYGKDRAFLSSGNNILDDDEFTYVIRDGLLLIPKSGDIGEGIIPSSPEKWEDFLQYATFWIGPWGFNLPSNDWRNDFEKLSEAEQEGRRKQLQTIFQKATAVELGASVESIEWPEEEMRTIAELYEKYENGEEEPSPLEEVEKLMKEEVANLSKTNYNDFWAKPEKPKKIEYEGFKKNGQVGIKIKNSSTVVIPANYEDVGIFNNKYFALESDTPTNFTSLHSKDGFILTDVKGNQVLPDKYYKIYRSFHFNHPESILVVERVVKVLRPCHNGNGNTTIWMVGLETERIFYDENLKIVDRERNERSAFCRQ